MKSSNYVRISLLAAALAMAGCEAEGTFTGTGGAGAGGGLAGGGGGGGGPVVGVEPIMQYASIDPNPIQAAKISGDAGTIVWADQADPFGTNMNNVIHLFSKRLSTATITQITAGDSNFSFAPKEWDVTDNGDFVVWASRLDWVGANANLEENIFMASTTGGGISQVTAIDAGAGTASNPQVANNGVLVFTSSDDLTGDNGAGVTQIFSINSDGTGLAQVTTGNLGPDDLSLSDTGNRVAFTAFGDPFGTNADNSEEVFVIDINGDNLTQLTATAGDSFTPRISGDGSRVAFVSAQDVVAGSNADGSYEVFVATSDGATVVQISANDTRGSGIFSDGTPGSMDLTGSGTLVVFASRANHTGENPDEDHTLYAAPAAGTGSITQILKDGTVSANAADYSGDAPSVINDGLGLAFISETNLTSANQEDEELIYTTVIP